MVIFDSKTIKRIRTFKTTNPDSTFDAKVNNFLDSREQAQVSSIHVTSSSVLGEG